MTRCCRSSPRAGLQVGKDFLLAFSPERVDPGRTDWTTKTTPKIVGGVTRRLHGRACALYERALDTVIAGLFAGGGRADQAPREHLPLGQHRARQRARAALRPHGRGRLGGRRRRGDEAVRVHELQAGPRPGRPLPPRRSLLPLLEGARVRLLHRVHRAGREDQREHALLLPGEDHPGAQLASRRRSRAAGAPRRRRLQGRRRRPARVARTQARRAPAGRGRRRLLLRPARARAPRAGLVLGVAGRRARGGRLRRHRHGALGHRLRRPGRSARTLVVDFRNATGRNGSLNGRVWKL